MHPGIWKQARALLLTLVFLGEVGGPSLDAVLYHSGSHPDLLRIHWDAKGRCEHHADHCVLGGSVSWPRLAAQKAVVLRESLLTKSPLQIELTSTLFAAYSGFQAHPRAPPAQPLV